MKWNTSISARTKPSKTTYEPLLKPTPLKTRKTRRGGTATSRVSDAKHGLQKKVLLTSVESRAPPKMALGQASVGVLAAGMGLLFIGAMRYGGYLILAFEMSEIPN